MTTKVTAHEHGGLVQFGKRVRIERHFRPEADGAFLWSVYRLDHVVKGQHPVHGDETTETETWIKVGEATEEAARAQAAKLAK